MTAVNYQERPLAPVLAFLLFVLVCMIGLPLWYYSAVKLHAPAHAASANGVLVLPLLGLFWLIAIARTFSFNARVRRDPRALQWDGTILSLWQGGRAETMPWQQVKQVSLRRGKRASDVSILRIMSDKPGGGMAFWSFPSGRLQLAGQSLTAIANQLEQARRGNPVPPASIAADPMEAARRDKRIAKARVIGTIMMVAYFTTGAGMAAYLFSSHTTLLTPFDPLLWLSAKIGFFAVSAAWFGSYAKSMWQLWMRSRRVFAWFFPKVVFTGLMSGVMMGGWCYLAANVYVTAKTFGGVVQRGAVLMIARPDVSFHGHPTVEARLMNRPGRVVVFTIDEADKKSMDQWYRPGVAEDTPCVTVPVEWAGRAIRSEVTMDDPLPPGSVSGCF